MRILISDLPKSPWWGTGITAYDDNWGMQDGVKPNQTIVEQEHKTLLDTLSPHFPIELVPFPSPSKYPDINHDFSFVRDHFISGNNHRIVICNLRRPERQPETKYLKDYFKSKDIKFQNLSSKAIADGGEFHYLPKENLLFAGLSRNNKAGVDEVAQKLDIDQIVMIETKAYHLDTVFSVLLDDKKRLAGILTSLEMLKYPEKVKAWAQKNNVPLIDLDPQDTIGPEEKPGNQSANSLALPGVLISGSTFTTPGAHDQIKSLGITHLVSPTSQFNLSGGSVHCLVNEL